MKSYQATVVCRHRAALTPERAITTIGALGTVVGVDFRPEYTMHQAQQVVNWLNGKDQKLKMVPRHMDSWDPAIRYPLKKPRRRR